ncbi:MAG TPA: rhomboid family intramembrane serine protease [Candidatus Polarisedimenticolia bacterium]|nr:rhomboid family intramembrane serine protease [Candidatus Polarisedimenticolia bacterium]
MPPRYEYGQQYRVSFGGPLTPGVKALIIANVAVFILELFIRRVGETLWLDTLYWFALNPMLVFTRLYLWQLVTYMFMHSPDGIFHILFNMLVLWMFGGEIERVWGTRRFVGYYLICGIGGAVANCAFAFMQPQTIGASGAIFGIIVAYGLLFPARTILFWMIFPMSARQFALLLGAIELVSLGAFSPDGVARFAHLGGALTGYLLIKGRWDPRRWLQDLRWRLRRRRFRTIDRDGRGDRDRYYPFH